MLPCRARLEHDIAVDAIFRVDAERRRRIPERQTDVIVGRYILQPEIFDILEHVEKGAGGEIQLTDGMIKLADAQAFHGVRFDGRTYDCGSKIGFLAANLAFALEREDLGPQLRAEMKKMGL